MSPEARQVIQAADTASRDLGHGAIGPEHLILGILSLRDEPAVLALSRYGMTATDVRAHLGVLAPATGPKQRSLLLTDEGKQVLASAVGIARDAGHHIDPTALLIAVLRSATPTVTAILAHFGVTPDIILASLPGAAHKHTGTADDATDDARAAHPSNETSGNAAVLDPDDKIADRPLGKVLASCSEDLTAKALAGELSPVFGRDEEITRLAEVLCRRTKNNAVLVGDPGIGKTAIIEGLAQRIVAGTVPDGLLGKRLLALDLASMTAGTRFRGDLEQRVKTMLKEIADDPSVLLFVDEIHQLLGAGAGQTGMGISEMIKPALARGEMGGLLGATTREEYVKHIEKDAALERRFSPVAVAEPTVAMTIDILRKARPTFEAHHGVRYTEEALTAAATLSARYIHDRRLPDKAIDLIDEAGAIAAIARMRLPEQARLLHLARNEQRTLIRDAVAGDDFAAAATAAAAEAGFTQAIAQEDGFDVGTVTDAEIADVVGAWTGIPANAMTEAEAASLRALPETLARHLVGQEHAISKLASAARRRRTGMHAGDRPDSYLFAGPTGVGKTELAKLYARFVYGDENALIQVDMSEFSEPHMVSRLLGAPPGYVGYDEKVPVLERIRRRPHSVLLLDEVEKADPGVFDAFLQVLEEGKLTDGTGRVIATQHLTIIMTTNLGASLASKPALGFGAASSAEDEVGHVEQATREAIKAFFRPEFLNRIDEIVPFRSLNRAEIKQIVDLLAARVIDQLAGKSITLVLDESAKDFLADAGYDKAFGARPLRRAIQRHLEDLLADAIHAGDLLPGDAVLVAARDGQLALDTTRNVVVPEDASTLVEPMAG